MWGLVLVLTLICIAGTGISVLVGLMDPMGRTPFWPALMFFAGFIGCIVYWVRLWLGS